MTPDLSARAVDACELMDDPDADIRMLERTSERVPLGHAVGSRWRSVYRRDIRPRARRRPISLLDVGAGGGDVSRALAAWARRDGLEISVTALDTDDRAIRWARERGGGVSYRHAHTRALVAAGERFDAVVSNHLLHHLTGEELSELLDESIRLVEDDGLVLHRDIARSRFAYRAFAAGTWAFQRNVLADSFIRDDGLTSIRRSYTDGEIAEIVPAGWQVRQEMPSRLELRWEAWDARP